ncbi:MAG TPA: hypothetical protein VL100_03625 [Croceibacterium sp.]|nr:hypothetical protein [Croceibacterium sp.]
MRKLALFLVLPLAACGPQQPATTEGASTPDPGPVASPAPSPTPTASAPVRDYTPPRLTADAEKGEKGARNLLLAWASAMEDRAFGPAYALFGEYAERTGQSASEYADTFADYRTVNAAIGEGTSEGAAGSIYYEVPVTLSGTTRSGGTYLREGTMTLRRVNDVDGATPSQLRWHLERLEWDK